VVWALRAMAAPGGNQKLFGFVAMELATVDASICTFFGVHSGLAMGSIYLDGSEEQKQKWLPPMARWEKIGCFGLTEPLVWFWEQRRDDHDRQARRGYLGSQRPEARWIGNAPWCDVSIIWARDVSDNQVKGFIVENKTTPALASKRSITRSRSKWSRTARLPSRTCGLPEADRLQGGNSFRDTARVLRMTRYMVWLGLNRRANGRVRGNAQVHPGATAVRQANCPRSKWCRISLAKMLANVTACQCLMVRLAQMNR